MLKIVRNADYDKWAKRVHEDDAPCIICGRGAGDNAPVVHVHNGGDSVVTSEESATLDKGNPDDCKRDNSNKG